MPRISTAPGSVNAFETNGGIVARPGADELWAWFGLSYARWLTLPRVLMHEMPDEWQGKMAALLREFNDAFPNAPAATTRVIPTEGKRLVKTPDWLLNYRYPDAVAIAACRGTPAEESDDGKGTEEEGGREEVDVSQRGRGDGLGGQDGGGHQGEEPAGR